MCSGSGSSKGGTTVEDQDRETRIDEDVEGHMNKAVNKGAVNKGRNLNKDEDDVEGHMHKAVNKGAVNKGRNLNKDEDDVEAHMNLNAVNKGMHKA
jgi:hypothetical protein